MTLDIEAWADYWASLKVDVVLVSVTGILAHYQTKAPYHRKGKYLDGRDFFGDCCRAAKRRGLRVIARLSPDLNWEDAVSPFPKLLTTKLRRCIPREVRKLTAKASEFRDSSFCSKVQGENSEAGALDDFLSRDLMSLTALLLLLSN